MHTRTLLAAPLALLMAALLAGHPSAQRAKPAPAPAEDADFGAFVKFATTRPEFSSPLVDHLPRKAGVPTPKDVLGYHVGAEKKLTTVPVNVDAVLFWMVHDAQKAALEVQDYTQAVSWAAQTALRDIIGRTTLTELLRGREGIEPELQLLIDQRSNPWGVTVSSVEMRDVVIPLALQDAMSREAQAAREKAARIILGEAELAIAHSFAEASKEYHNNPTALHLLAMNMQYEEPKEKGALTIIPSSAVESMGMGGLMGTAALQQQLLAGGGKPGDAAGPSA